MSFITPRTRGKLFVQHRTRLDRENPKMLHAYSAFIDEAPEYVLNELIDTVLAKDKDFLKWRADHPQSFVHTLAASEGSAERQARWTARGRPARSDRPCGSRTRSWRVGWVREGSCCCKRF